MQRRDMELQLLPSKHQQTNKTDSQRKHDIRSLELIEI